MALDLEIIDYDLEGAAYDANGTVVDGAFLIATVKRRPVVTNGVMTAPPGETTRIRIAVADLDAKTKASLFKAFGDLEAIVKAQSVAHVEAKAADPAALDARVQAADDADKRRADAEKAKAELDAEIAARRAELDALKKQGKP